MSVNGGCGILILSLVRLSYHSSAERKSRAVRRALSLRMAKRKRKSPMKRSEKLPMMLILIGKRVTKWNWRSLHKMLS
jgi:hypothetical protein